MKNNRHATGFHISYYYLLKLFYLFNYFNASKDENGFKNEMQRIIEDF